MYESMRVLVVSERYRKYSAGLVLKSNPRDSWKYAIKSVVEEFVRPFSWSRISNHRYVDKSLHIH
jgi:hypothetical protein